MIGMPRGCGSVTGMGWLAAALAATVLGCAPKVAGPPPLTVDQIVAQGDQQGLRLENPFALNDTIRAKVEKEIGFTGTPLDRIRRIIRYLNDNNYIHFQYSANLSLTANQAFEARKGDCLAYTNLFLAIARHLKIPMYFVHVSEARNLYERDGVFFISSHMALGYGGGIQPEEVNPYTVIVDFTEESADYKLAMFEALDDGTALCLYYNNVAVDRMIEGDSAYAQRLLQYLIGVRPLVKELYNNMGVLLMREGNYAGALAFLQSSIQRFPGYAPLYTNAIQAARGSGRPELARTLEGKVESMSRDDPFFLFNQGLHFFHQGQFEKAAERFKKAANRQPYNTFLYAWLARAYLRYGRTEEGIRAFEKAQEYAPNHRMLALLRAEFPVLNSVPRPQLPPAQPQ